MIDKNPFTWISNIVSTRDNVWEEGSEQSFPSFMINRGLSYHYDCIMFANEMNKAGIPPKFQYDFLLHSIQPKKKRFAKWAKPEKDEFIDLFSTWFGMSKNVAQSYISLLSMEELDSIKNKFKTGGRNGAS